MQIDTNQLNQIIAFKNQELKNLKLLNDQF
jgi:hypothetical protein